MNNNINKEPIIIGTLKNEKSSKPFLVLIIFALIIGICFFLPEIKDYINNSNISLPTYIKSFLGNSNNNYVESQTTTTSTTTTNKIEEKDSLTCLNSEESYIYNFSNHSLNHILHEAIFTNENQYLLIFTNEIVNKVNEFSYQNTTASITNEEDKYIYNANIDLNEFEISPGTNYFTLNEKYENVLNEMTQKGYDCK